MLVDRTLVRGSVRLGYGEGPAAGPPLVLLHGLMEDRRGFAPLLEAWCARHHVFALDLRGHGTSDWTPGAYALHHDDVGDALALITERVPPRPALLGHSQGALIACALAARASELLSALVLVDPPLPCLADDCSSIARVIEMFGSIRSLLVETGGGSAAHEALLARLSGTDLMADQTSLTDPDRITSVIDVSAYDGPRWPELFARITCPTLLLQADPARGAVLSDDDAGTALEILTHGRLVCMSGSTTNASPQRADSAALTATDVSMKWRFHRHVLSTCRCDRHKLKRDAATGNARRARWHLACGPAVRRTSVPPTDHRRRDAGRAPVRNHRTSSARRVEAGR